MRRIAAPPPPPPPLLSLESTMVATITSGSGTASFSAAIVTNCALLIMCLEVEVRGTSWVEEKMEEGAERDEGKLTCHKVERKGC